ncbi:uncharacterized protein KY384_008301 [Bacidia gigantensis]|uniref:uncharacterized protein n=1 Tax=Bacidia gigantensis TaxID=2732470 RepID=UPI001D0399E0|nr:uncharacterized protein KY384_008301 [Bacidia gigantensis]KAG8526872.1 hypothetical protein KY384_008301 [Bacidia gigantensis]
MPTRGKRNIAEFDPNKSDSEDETYGSRSANAARSRPTASRTSRPPRKRRRRDYDGANSSPSEISESEINSIESYSQPEDEDEEEVEIGATGRPKRKAARNVQPIIEDDDSAGSDEDDKLEQKPSTRNNAQPKSLWIALPVVLPDSPAAPPELRRSQRTRSGSAATSRPTSAGTHVPATRRSSRKPSVQSPTEGFKRPTRGGKGPKKGIAPIEAGEDEESSGQLRDQGSTDELQKDHYRHEIAESHEDLAQEPEGDDQLGDKPFEDDIIAEVPMTDEGEGAEIEIPESEGEDENPISRTRRATRQRGVNPPKLIAESRRLTRARDTALGKRKMQETQKSVNQESSDFEPAPEDAEEEDVSDSAESASPRKRSQNDDDDESSPLGRDAKRRKVSRRSRRVSSGDSEQAELREEMQDLKSSRSKRRIADILMEEKKSRVRRQRDKQPNYNIMASNAAIGEAIEEYENEPASQRTPSKKAGGSRTYGRSLFSTYGPFGGAGVPAILGGPAGLGAVGGADSDSSDDESMPRPRPVGTLGGTFGMTPTSAHPGGFGLFPAPQVHGADPVQGPGGTPANLGKIKDKQALADADPLGVDQNVDFGGVGGLGDHIHQLKEMVTLPLLYPELLQKFHVTPPRGVLFHGPPGTGKTLLARALSNVVSSRGKKITFYMRKGADALSKWVGEAERQLRLLFEEARKNQPSIIFFDEIDGLAPVRSSKQEQIHASIVSTLLALMDGMDGRGQVIVIGATNRPDSVDPALRRPGRFDREFYFPLPNTEARRSILGIHTKDWTPQLQPSFLDEIAKATKGYGGADLRALCTEAALNAVQRRYPQIYKSNEKLQVKPETVQIGTKDFMLSIKKMVPSSERSASSAAAPLPSSIEPLLREALKGVKDLIASILPQKQSLTALEEAEFEDAEDERGMAAEQMQQEFERSRVFRPRLLIRGIPGMGQQYLSAAILHHFERLHVQAFDLSTLLSDSTRSSEAAIVQLFTEVRRHKPSVIYIPNVYIWYQTVGPTVISTLCGLLRSLTPSDPIMLLGVLECEENDLVDEDMNPLMKQMLADLFGYSRKSRFTVPRPSEPFRLEYFNAINKYIRTSPAEFPDPTDRKKRTLEILPVAPPEPTPEKPPLTKKEIKEQRQKDHLALNMLKTRIQPVMDMIKSRYRKFRLPVIDEKDLRYFLEEDDPDIVTSDLPRELANRPYEIAVDAKNQSGFKETSTGKFFYNIHVALIEQRLSNGYYARPKDYAAEVKKLTKDAEMIGDEERLLKANELFANVEVDMAQIEAENPYLIAELEHVAKRQAERQKAEIEKAKRKAAEEGRKLDFVVSNAPPPSDPQAPSTGPSSGVIKTGQPLPNGFVRVPIVSSNPSTLTNGISRLSDLSNLDVHTQTNNSSLRNQDDIDVIMTNSDDRSPDNDSRTYSSVGQSAQTRHLESLPATGGTVEDHRARGETLTQTSAVTGMIPGSQPADYVNTASTTSSEKRQYSSGDKETPVDRDTQSCLTPRENTQASQSSTRPLSNHSNTSPPLSQGQTLSQQERSTNIPAIPPFPSETTAGKPTISSLLNTGPPPRSRQASGAEHPPFKIDRVLIDETIRYFVEQSSGCSVEQLEQCSSAMMDEIWRTRGEWDRMSVTTKVRKRFQEEIDDIRDLQHQAMGSMEFA